MYYNIKKQKDEIFNRIKNVIIENIENNTLNVSFISRLLAISSTKNL